MSNILLINDNVQDYHIIIEACKENTYPITYNQTTDTYDSIFEKYQSLLNDPSNNIQTIDHVALVSHGTFGNTFTFLEKEENMLLSKYIYSEKEPENIQPLSDISGGEFSEPEPEPEHLLNNLETWGSFKEFIQKFNIQKSLDFLGCALLQSNNWKYILSELETEQHLNLNIRASDDDTGNLKVGGDWVLESDNVNIKELYFHGETIEKWKILLTDGTLFNFTKIVASDRAAGDHFGKCVAMSGDGTKVIVGAPYEDPGDTYRAGSAYIYAYNGSSWTETKIVASDGDVSDYFGYSVAMSGDGTKVIVGAKNEDPDDVGDAGSAYIYTYDGSSWDTGTKIVASDREPDDEVGYSVAMSGDGTKVIVGAKNEDPSYAGAAYIYTYDGSSWDTGTKIVAFDKETRDYFGYSVAMNSDGTNVIVGAYYEDPGDTYRAGSAYIYTYDGSSWDTGTKIVASDGDVSDYFGFSVAMSGDGTKVIVGAAGDDDVADVNFAGSAYIYTYDGSSWDTGTKIVASDREQNDEFAHFGFSVAMSGDGTKVIVGAAYEDGENSLQNAGSAYIYAFNGSYWDTGTKIVPSDRKQNDYFGFSVAMSGDGTKVIVGAKNEDPGGITFAGSAYIYELTEPPIIVSINRPGEIIRAIKSPSRDIAYQGFFNGGRLENIPATKITAGPTANRYAVHSLGNIRYNTDNHYIEVIQYNPTTNTDEWMNLITTASDSITDTTADSSVNTICFITEDDNNEKLLKISSTSIDDIKGNYGLILSHGGSPKVIFESVIYFPSDDRLKHNEEVIPNSLDLIEKLKPYKYQKTDKMYDASYNGIVHDKWLWEIGLIAQDVSTIPYFNFMVNQMPKDGRYTLSYLNLIGLLVQGTKDLYDENKSLKKDIETCKKDTRDVSGSVVVTIQELNNKIEELKSRVLALKK